jgi:ParB-like chromosome segregation protein Spo0J
MFEDILKLIKKEYDSCDNLDKQVEFINKLNKIISELSPFKEPVNFVKWVKMENIQANEYNPNHVATPEMELLYQSIKLDGYTQPIVAYQLNKTDYEIVDGFHRNRVGKEHEDIKNKLNGYLPLTVINKPLDERIGSTIRHNRARGSHQIRSMSEIVLDLSKSGWSDNEICDKLGMEMDEVLRLKQITGLKEAFSNHVFSKSWTEFESKVNTE